MRMSLTCQYVWLFLLLLVSISELLSEVDLLLLDSATRENEVLSRSVVLYLEMMLEIKENTIIFACLSIKVTTHHWF